MMQPSILQTLDRHPGPRKILAGLRGIRSVWRPHRQPKVRQLDLPLVRDEQVPARDVAVQDPVAVEVVQGEEEPLGDGPELGVVEQIKLVVELVQAPEAAAFDQEALGPFGIDVYPFEPHDVFLACDVHEGCHLLLDILHSPLVLGHLHHDPAPPTHDLGQVRVCEVSLSDLPSAFDLACLDQTLPLVGRRPCLRVVPPSCRLGVGNNERTRSDQGKGSICHFPCPIYHFPCTICHAGFTMHHAMHCDVCLWGWGTQCDGPLRKDLDTALASLASACGIRW